jgi:pilus assembly protein Flp/PilA
MLQLMCTLEVLGIKSVQSLRARRRDDRGQTAAEYMGIIVIVSAVIVLIAATDIKTTISQAIQTSVASIAG